ncbi:hypothetical protein BJ912DRAFT_1142308 [Pholiota molesta]|nr:hypothetical protein BJ912DRAFT_1142308 [Pholiota molesta]
MPRWRSIPPQRRPSPSWAHSRAPTTKEGEERVRGDPGAGDPQASSPRHRAVAPPAMSSRGARNHDHIVLRCTTPRRRLRTPATSLIRTLSTPMHLMITPIVPTILKMGGVWDEGFSDEGEGDDGFVWTGRQAKDGETTRQRKDTTAQ